MGFLVQNLVMIGRHKLADRRANDVYAVVKQSDPSILEYEVRSEGLIANSKVPLRSIFLFINYLAILSC